MDTAAFDYDLPPDRVAQVPVEPRDRARLLVDRGDAPVGHARVRDLPDLLAPGDLVVVNETRVLPARLRLRKATGGAVEVLLLERGADGWEALVRPGRRVAPGTELVAEGPGGAGLGVRVLDVLGDGRRRVQLTGPAVGAGGARGEGAGGSRAVAGRRAAAGDGSPDDDGDGTGVPPAELAALEALGEVPLPPYITEPLADPERYQTVFARRAASVAAPTAGLHLTGALLDRLRARGVAVAPVELVVGLGTFRPISAGRVEDHRMHEEAYRVPAPTWAAVAAARSRGGRVVAVGTTVVRALETAAARGELEGSTDLFIHGAHPFAVVDRLVTNFHTPRSSLLVLVEALIGPRWRRLYDEALAGGYRFLSFGDAMLLSREPPQ